MLGGDQVITAKSSPISGTFSSVGGPGGAEILSNIKIIKFSKTEHAIHNMFEKQKDVKNLIIINLQIC